MIAAALALTGCAPDPSDLPDDAPVWQLETPDGLGEPLVPAENPATPEKFELGRHLFYDPRLSGNGTQACATCHDQALGFADGEVTPTGSTGTVLARNSPGLVNVAWEATLTWPNPLLTTLEAQLLVPMFGDAPVELGMSGHEDEIRARLEADPVYAELGAAAFPDADPFDRTALVAALATFVRGLASTDAPYDRYVQGRDPDALSDAARRGMTLFFSERAECYHCHGGPNLTASFVNATSAAAPDAFFNTPGCTTSTGRAATRPTTPAGTSSPASTRTWGGSGPRRCGTSR
ncbi:MAG: cytochrome-c peroxidase [Myxococcota bacterium]